MLKRGILIIIAFLTLIALFLSGCNKELCLKDQILIDNTCCFDRNYNFICDNQEDIAICGDGTCHPDENCTNCWEDCGVCKVITKVYIPVNFSLKNFTTTMDPFTGQKLFFRKDLDYKNNVSDYFYHEDKVNRYISDLEGAKYNTKTTETTITLSKIKLTDWWLNSTDALPRFVNQSRYYIIQKPLNKDRYDYIQRIIKNTAKEDYAATGPRSEYRYEDWVAKNFSENVKFLYENLTLLNNSMVWDVHAGITDYVVDYITGRYEDDKDDDDIPIYIDQHKFVTEKKLDYVNTVTFKCSRNMAVTLSDYSYDVNYMGIEERFIMQEMRIDRDALIKEAEELQEVCRKKFSNGVFVP